MTSGERVGAAVVAVEAIDGWDAQGLKAIAVSATSTEPHAIVALFTTTTPAQVVIARGCAAGIDAGAVLKQLSAEFGGKGGGKPDLAQGGGLVGSSEQLVESVRQFLDSNF